MRFIDQLERSVQLKKTPDRIISLVPSQTELLVDLGLEHSIVGVTKFCIHPNHLRKSKTIVGGTKQINIEKIRALSPDIILCNKEENSKEIIELLEDIAPIHISDIYNLKDCLELIKMYGSLFQVEDKALEIVSSIQNERNRFRTRLSVLKNIKIAYFIWRNPWMVSASDTFINHMINEAGFQNVYEDERRYPEIDLENSKIKVADIIFLSSEPYPFKNKHIKELELHFPQKRIKIIDGEMFSWYGSRLQKSYKYFESLHDFA